MSWISLVSSAGTASAWTPLPGSARGGAGQDEAGRAARGAGAAGGPGLQSGGAAASLGLSGRPPQRCRCSSRGGECGCRSQPGTSSEPTRLWR